MTEQQITEAAKMWRARKDTCDIALAMVLPEFVVCNNLWRIRMRAQPKAGTA